MRMTQKQHDSLNAAANALVDQFRSGLLTTIELVRETGKLANWCENMTVDGIVDLNTGLRY